MLYIDSTSATTDSTGYSGTTSTVVYCYTTDELLRVIRSLAMNVSRHLLLPLGHLCGLGTETAVQLPSARNVWKELGPMIHSRYCQQVRQQVHTDYRNDEDVDAVWMVII